MSKKAGEVMQVFLVMKYGISHRMCAGVFTDLEEAKEVARTFIRAEPDDWHHYGVIPYNVGASVESVVSQLAYQNPDGGFEPKEPEPVWKIEREDEWARVTPSGKYETKARNGNFTLTETPT